MRLRKVAGMAAIPSIKGSVFSTLVEDVRKALDGAGLSRSDATKWLEPSDLALFDLPIIVAGWYDIRSYDRMNALLLELVGGGSHEFFRQQGSNTARRLLEGGLYAQLEYLQRTQASKATGQRSRFEAFGRDLRLLTSLSASILNFSRWSSRPDPDTENRYRIDVSEAAAFPESLCWRSEGFVNGMAAVHGGPSLWSWSRATQDHVVFHMVRSL
jgi:hypothetical protein